MPVPKPDDFVDGPILTFLSEAPAFDRFYLLYDPRNEASGALAALTGELPRRFPPMAVVPQYLPLADPRAYEPLYRGMRAVCEKVRSDAGPEAELHVLVSPGTPQMHATWILLAKTVFPAGIWQASDQPGQPRAEQVQIPLDIDAELVEPARQEGRTAKPSHPAAASLVAESEAMKRVVAMAVRAAATNESVLLLGEPGVGKERIAQLIHEASRRSSGPFVAVNVATVPPTLAESELFGTVKGAYNEARDRPGYFEQADGGTILLDEIGDLPLDLQPKLLRVLQERTVRRLGDIRDRVVDIRVIAATNADLEAAVAERRFRRDLYRRIEVLPITIPPLRERREDIGPLTDAFLSSLNEQRGRDGFKPLRLMPSARRLLYSHPWPGNVGQLENLVRRLVALAEEDVIRPADVAAVLPPVSLAEVIGKIDVTLRPGWGLKKLLDEIEHRILVDAWKRYGSQAKAAAALGLRSQQAFERKWRKRPERTT